MTPRLREFPHWSARRTLVVAVAGALGFGLNLYPVYVYGGVWLFVGQIPALACTLLLGPAGGIVAATGAISGLAVGALSAAGFITPTQVATWTLLLLEAVAVGELARRHRGPITALLLYWVVIGAPVMTFFLLVMRKMPAADVALVVGKNVLSGVFNVGVAAILSGRSPTAAWMGHAAERRDTIVTQLNARISAVVTLPVLIVMIAVSKWSQHAAEQTAMERLQLETAREANALREYLIAHRRTIEFLARVSMMPVGARTRDRSELLGEARASDSGFLSMLITDATGGVRTIASGTGAPVRRAAIDRVADRPYFTEPMRTGQSFLSGVFRGRSIGTDVIAALSAPIISPTGRPIGVVEGSLDLSKLRTVLSRPADVDITVIDQERRVVFSTAGSRRPILSGAPAGVPFGARATGRLWNSDPKLITSKRETFYAVAPSAFGWSVLLEMPRYLALRGAEVNSTAVFAACLLLFGGSLVSVRFVNRVIAEPLEALEMQASSLQWEEPIVEPATAGRTLRAPREIAVVREALTNAAKRISESFRSMRQAVADRDAALAERDRTVQHLDTLVQERTQELEKERDHAAAASRAKSAFLANMSHELRTPLNVALGRAEAFSEGVYGPLTPAQREAFVEIDTQGRHLLALIGDILDLARIESGKLTVDAQRTNVYPLLLEVVSSFRDIAAARGVHLTLDASADPCVIRADLFRLRQVVVNLVGNAVKFTNSGGRVSVVVVRRGDGAPIAIQVADTGVGIPPDRLPFIFGAFEQGDPSATRLHGGAGLGLTISRALSEAMGMRISVASVVGIGSTFSLEFADDSADAVSSGALHGPYSAVGS